MGRSRLCRRRAPPGTLFLQIRETRASKFGVKISALLFSSFSWESHSHCPQCLILIQFLQCKEFKGHVDRLVAEIRNAPTGVSSPSQPIVVGRKEEKEANILPNISELFKKVEGSWNCSGCYLSNGPDVVKCPSCETFKPEVEDHSTSSCPGCIGCDPDAFDFSKLDNRQVPVYAEQTMSPEEYKQHLSKEKLVNFSFSSPTSGLSAFNSSGGSTGSPLFSGFNSSNSFFSSTSLSPMKPAAGSGGLQVVDFGATGGPTNFTFGTLAQASPTSSTKTEPFPQFSSPENEGAEDGEVDVEDDDDDEEYEDEEEEEEVAFEGQGTLRVRKHGESGKIFLVVSIIPQLNVRDLYFFLFLVILEMRDLGKGAVVLSYDSEMYCNRFHFSGENTDEAVEHVICADSQITVSISLIKFNRCRFCVIFFSF